MKKILLIVTFLCCNFIYGQSYVKEIYDFAKYKTKHNQMEEISPGYFEAIYEGYNNQDIEVSLIFFDHTVLIELKEKSYNGFHNFSELQDLIRTMGIKMYYEYGNPEQDRLYEQDVLTLKKGISKDERVAISKVQFNEYDNRIIIYVED